jgi:hypothetical protein
MTLSLEVSAAAKGDVQVHDGGEAMGDDQHGHPGKALFDRRGDLGVHPEGQLDPVERI